jgi:capsular polysaccharide export protein
VLRGQSVAALFAVVQQVEVISSLAGFEALLRGVPVTTHGKPFYAGWGLTEDLDPPPRRSRTLILDELVAIALMVYPHYYDPESGLACPLDVVLERLEQARTEPQGMVRTLRSTAGLAAARALHWWMQRGGG